MEIHQVVGLIAVQVIIVPAAYAASNLAGQVLRGMAHRVHLPGWRLTYLSTDGGRAFAPKLGLVSTWALFNTAFVILAGVI